jgi:hypothetical protein
LLVEPSTCTSKVWGYQKVWDLVKRLSSSKQ